MSDHVEELAKVIASTPEIWARPPGAEHDHAIARAILAAGYRKGQPDAALREALTEIAGWDEGLLGGDPSWTVGQWQDYIRDIIRRISERAIDALVASLKVLDEPQAPPCEHCPGEAVRCEGCPAPPPAGPAVTAEMVERACAVLLGKHWTPEDGRYRGFHVGWRHRVKRALAAALERGEARS